MKRFVLISILTVITAGAIIVSCSKDTQNQYGDKNMSYLPLSDMEVHPLGDRLPLSYTSEGGWDLEIEWISGDKNWITTGIRKGSPGTTYMEIDVSPCITEDREARILFKNGGIILDDFVITQDKAVIDIPDEQYILKWLHTQSERTFKVNSNIQWKLELDNTSDFEITSDNDGIQGAIAKNFDKTDVEVSFRALAPNLSRNTSKTATIKLTPVKIDYNGEEDGLGMNVNNLTKTIEISQDYLIFAVEDASGKTLENGDYLHEFNELGSELSSKILGNDDESTKEIKVILENGYEWGSNLGQIKESGVIDVSEQKGTPQINEEDQSREEVETSVTLTWLKPNTKRDTTKKDIKFWIKDENGKPIEGTEMLFEAVQKGYVFSVDYDDKTEQYNYERTIQNKGDTLNLKVNTTGPWSLELPDWMKKNIYLKTKGNNDYQAVGKLEGTGDAEIKIEVDQNLNFEDNVSEDLKFKTVNTDYTNVINDLNIPFDVTQNKFRFDVKYENDTPTNGISRMDTDPYSIVVTSDGPWTLKMDATDEEWLKVVDGVEFDSENGVYKGTACDNLEVKVAASEYNTLSTKPEDDRKRVLNFQSESHAEGEWGNKDKIGLNFIQQSLRTDILTPGTNNEFKLPEDNFAAYKKAGIETDFYVNCSAPWELKVTYSKDNDVPWIKFYDDDDIECIKGDGRQYKTIVMKVDTNKETREREATVQVNVTVGEKIESIPLGKLTQAGFVFEVKSADSYSFPALSDTTVNAKITTTYEAGWRITEMGNTLTTKWYGPDKDSGEGSYTLNFAPENNGALEERECTVRVVSTVNDKLYKDIVFSQAAYEFNRTAENLKKFDEISDKNQPQKLEVVCTGAWKLQEVPYWIKVSMDVDGKDTEISKGTGDQTLKVTTKQNHTGIVDDRSGSFKVVSEVGGHSHVKVVNVSQNKYTWEVDGMETIVELGPLETKDIEVSILSSGNWTAGLSDSNSGFDQPDETKGDACLSDPQKTTLKITENYTLRNREVEFYVQSDHYDPNAAPHLKTKCKIQQGKYDFVVLVVDKTISATGGTETFNGLKCSGKLTWERSQDWVTPKIDSSTGVLTVEVKENTGTSRTATVTIKSEHWENNNDLQKTFTITQQAAPESKQ